jgi:hypothetical protein
MGEEENRQAVEEFARALESGDTSQLMSVFDKYVADDYVQEWPQSGERIRGKANAKAINENYPDMPRASLRSVNGSGDMWTAEFELDYPQQGKFFGVSLFQFRNGQVVKETDYFSPPTPAPEWRAQWVEKM